MGLGNGQVLIFDVFKNSAYEDDVYVVLKESKGKNLYSIQISLFLYFSRCFGGLEVGLSSVKRLTVQYVIQLIRGRYFVRGTEEVV